MRSRNSKVTCCHFSSDGKWLASAGEDMKVIHLNNNDSVPHSTNICGEYYNFFFLVNYLFLLYR